MGSVSSFYRNTSNFMVLTENKKLNIVEIEIGRYSDYPNDGIISVWISKNLYEDMLKNKCVIRSYDPFVVDYKDV